MIAAPRRPEIDHRTIKLIVGAVAISLATLTDVFARTAITSVSAAYYEVGWSQSIFIGFLFAIAAFLLAYNGKSRRQMIASKVASIAGLGIALFPCGCDTHVAVVPYVHEVSAAAMFLILAYFCYTFYQRALTKTFAQAKVRAGIYVITGMAILASIVVLALDGLSGHALRARIPRLTFYGEGTALVAFGVSWLTASRVFPLVTNAKERFWPLRDVNPD